jgi:7-cyano-7-deazaguanine synthase
MKNVIILCSGGLDSVVATYSVKDQYEKLKFLFFDYGQRTEKQEEYFCRKIAEKLDGEFVKVELRWLGEISQAAINKNIEIKETTEQNLENNKRLENWWVPCRNSIFLINALAFAESEFLKNKERYDVVIGLKNEGAVHFKDTTQKFLDKIQELSEEATNDGGFKVLAPLIELDKPEVVKLGEKLGVPFELTYSCYIGSEELKHCGKCLNCMLRKKGFYWSGIEDPSSY